MRVSIVLAAICFLGVASASSLVKRSFLDDFQNKTQDALHNLENFGQDFNEKIQDALKNLFGNHESTEKNVTKRATNPLTLINDLKDPGQFAQDLVKMLAEMAVSGRRKRDLAEDLRKFAEAGKQRAQDALKKIMDLFGSFKNGGASDESSTEQTVSKRDVSEDLQKLADAGKEKVQAALKQLQELFEQFKGGFNHDESSETVTKRDVSESLRHFSQVAQEKTQAAFQHLREAFAGLFGKRPTEQVEDSTEVSVSKRDIFSNFGKFNQDLQQQAQQALSGFRQAFSGLLNQFRPAKPAKVAKPVEDEIEDTTSSA